MNPKWFRFDNAAADPTVAEIHIIDFIGDWIDQAINEYYGVDGTVTAKAFVDQLAKLPDAVTTIRVHINSPGGDVFAALNIANALRDQQVSKGRYVETVIDGLAASAASVIAMAGKKILMADNALMMIHAPWSVAIGNAAEMRKNADVLDTVRDTLISKYLWHATITRDELVALVEAETWLTADQAVEAGLATEVVAGLKAAASINPRAVERLKVPAQYRERVAALLVKSAPATPAPVAATAAEILDVCGQGGCLERAAALLAAGSTLEHVRAAVELDKATKAEAATRATGIRSICDRAKQPELAAGYIAGGMTVDQVRAHVAVITAKQDIVEIDSSLKPDAGRTRTASALNSTEIYQDRNRRGADQR